jgi:predicted phage-related endonuclease
MFEVREIVDRAEWLKWREDDITASDAACLFGAEVHPHTTAYQQWAIKSGLHQRSAMDPKLARRGEYIEKIAPQLIMEERPTWRVIPCRHYFRDNELNIGATPDLWGRRPDRAGVGMIDVKSVGPTTLQRWRDRETGNTELPVHYAIQVNIQAGVAEGRRHEEAITWGAVAAITIGDAGLDIEILDVPLLPGLYENFKGLAADFWRRVKEKDPYPIDWGRDADAILDMHRDEDGSTVDLSDDEEFLRLLKQREQCKQIEADGTAAEKFRRKVDAQLINKLGNAANARYGNVLLRAPTVRVQEAVRKAYSFRRISIKGQLEGDETYESRAALPSSDEPAP